MYKVKDTNTIILQGFKTAFGGGRSTGFGMIYENMDSLAKFEPRYRKLRFDLPAPPKSKKMQRRGFKEFKNKLLKTRAKKKRAMLGK